MWSTHIAKPPQQITVPEELCCKKMQQAQEFFYGPLGEGVKNKRTIVIPQHDQQSYTTEWTYDTWNRLTSMIYADGETVTYTYNAGGVLRSMNGKKKKHEL